jgi:quercetin dioxygenase-like cupin family protein
MKVIHTSEDAYRSGGDEWFVGEAQVQPVVGPPDGLGIAVVRFSAGARTYLHTHEAPQVLHCIEGRGILATEDERNEVGPGDIVYVPADEMHWHGATEEGSFTHLSIRPPGETRWTKTDPLAAR